MPDRGVDADHPPIACGTRDRRDAQRRQHRGGPYLRRPLDGSAADRNAANDACPGASVPTPKEFTINVIVTEQNCEPGPGCVYKYTIEPKYIGFHPLPTTPFTVKYEVQGGDQPQPGEFTVEGSQAKIFKDVLLEGPPAARLQAVVLQVIG